MRLHLASRVALHIGEAVNREQPPILPDSIPLPGRYTNAVAEKSEPMRLMATPFVLPCEIEGFMRFATQVLPTTWLILRRPEEHREQIEPWKKMRGIPP